LHSVAGKNVLFEENFSISMKNINVGIANRIKLGKARSTLRQDRQLEFVEHLENEHRMTVIRQLEWHATTSTNTAYAYVCALTFHQKHILKKKLGGSKNMFQFQRNPVF
jgi:hypothetical protein